LTNSEQLSKEEKKNKTAIETDKRPTIRFVFAFLVAAVSLFFVFYLGYETYLSKIPDLHISLKAQEEKINRLEISVNSLKEKYRDRNKTLTDLKVLQQALAKKSEEQDRFIDAEFSKLKGKIRKDLNFLLLLELDYLIKLANQWVLIGRDSVVALSLLEEASDILKNNKVIGTSALRNALMQDIIALKAVNNVDLEEVYVKLGNLMEEVRMLTATPEDFSYQGADVRSKESSPESGESVSPSFSIDLLITKFVNLIEFGKVDTTFRPLIFPEQEYYLKQNILLKLNIAQSALVTNNKRTFQQAIYEALDLLSGPFDRKNKGLLLITELEKLGNLSIDSGTHSLDKSMISVRADIMAYEEAIR
jgi:uroporphyrin-3 C-methyltransferase